MEDDSQDRTMTEHLASVRYLVDDVAAAADFYAERLGFVLRADARPALAEMVRGPLRLLLSGPASTAARAMPDGRTPAAGGWNRIHLVVQDLDGEISRLRASGVVFRNDVTTGPGGRQILLDDPSGNPVELFEPARPGRPGDSDHQQAPVHRLRSRVLLRSEDTGGHISLVENTVPAGSAGPPLHRHDFDELFYVLDGELDVLVGDARGARAAGQLAFVARGTPHALANRSARPATYLLVCTPAGFERQLARSTAEAEGTEPPLWALQPGPEVVRLGPPLGQGAEDPAVT